MIVEHPTTSTPTRRSVEHGHGLGALRPLHLHTAYLPIGAARGLFITLLAVIVLLRVTNINYRTLFVDEAIYATVGQDILVGVFKQNAPSFIFGSYLYPMLAGLANAVGGVEGLRLLAAALSSITAVLVYLVTARLFSRHAALWAMAIFGLTGISIELGQLAVVDDPAVPLLALTLYLLVTVALSDARDGREDRYLLAAAVSFSLACLSKYIAIMYLPALCAVVLALYVLRGRPLQPLLKFPWTLSLILGIYVFLYRDDLVLVFHGTNSYQYASRWAIVQVVWAELTPVLLMTVVGAALLSQVPLTAPHFPVRWRRIAPAGVMPLLLVLFLVPPIYAWWSHNSRSLEKHLVYSLVFLTPVAGYACATLIEQMQRLRGTWARYARASGAIVTVLALVWFSDYSLGRNWGFQHSWPSTRKVIAYLKADGLSHRDRVLASGSYIYDYYLNFGVAYRAMWHSTWYLAYKGRTGLAAMQAALHDHWFTYVILDDYYTTDVAQKLPATLHQAGYALVYHTRETLSFGAPISTRVYALPHRHQAGGTRNRPSLRK